MTTGTFDYYVLYKRNTTQAGNLIAAWMGEDVPLRAVMWSHEHQEWVYAPATAAVRLFDDRFQEMFARIDRRTAEQIALERLESPLPEEDTLRQICLEGQRLGHQWGPPRLP